MPVWHKITAPLEGSGTLKVFGIVQEQHADRARLYMQWQQMDWPVQVDSFNLLEVAAVPITVLIDEFGIVQKVRAKPGDLEAFLDADYDDPKLPSATPALSIDETTRSLDPAAVNAALEAAAKPTTADTHFRHGVLHRLRYDSPLRQADDFAKAIHHWSAALKINPNQYIWRRRIQQYGPRLDKPYPFYDWIPIAQQEIAARGEVSVVLTAALSGAEVAQPEKTLSVADQTTDAHPDPDQKLNRDDNDLIAARVVAVPNTGDGEKRLRVHLELTPNAKKKAHWNNESGDATIWVGKTKVATLTAPDKAAPTSSETRSVEFEITPGEEEAATLFFYVCEGIDGTCLYLAKEISIP